MLGGCRFLYLKLNFWMDAVHVSVEVIGCLFVFGLYVNVVNVSFIW